MNMGSMLVNSPHDIAVLLMTFVCGQFTGVIFDVFRAFRCVYPPGKNMIAAQDIVFCALAFFLFSKTLEIFNQGDVRWFEIAGVLLGFLLYLSAESSFVKPVLTAFFRLWDKIITKLLEAISSTLHLIKKPFIKHMGKIRVLFKNAKTVFGQKCTKKLAKKR